MGKRRQELCRSGFVPGDRYGSRIGLAGYHKVVNTQHPLSCLKYLFLSFLLSLFRFLYFHYTTFSIGLCRSLPPPPSAAKSPSSFGRWLPSTKKEIVSKNRNTTFSSEFSVFLKPFSVTENAERHKYRREHKSK